MTPLFIGGIGMQEVLLIALVVLLFFGGKKIPELMKGIGQGVHSFKECMNIHVCGSALYLPILLASHILFYRRLSGKYGSRFFY